MNHGLLTNMRLVLMLNSMSELHKIIVTDEQP